MSFTNLYKKLKMTLKASFNVLEKLLALMSRNIGYMVVRGRKSTSAIFLSELFTMENKNMVKEEISLLQSRGLEDIS